MKRTPVVKRAISAVRNANQIGDTPPRPKTTRRLYSRMMSSDQVASIFNHPMSPVSSPVTVKRLYSNLRYIREGNATIRMPLARTRNSGSNPNEVTLGNSSPLINVSRSDTHYKREGIRTMRKPLVDNTNYGSDDVILINPAESTPSNSDFCEMFSGWLKKKEGDIEKADFANLKADLLTLVGKYELEFSHKKL